MLTLPRRQGKRRVNSSLRKYRLGGWQAEKKTRKIRLMNIDLDQTLLRLFHARVQQNATRGAVYVARDGEFCEVRWGELSRDVFRTAQVLHRLGVEPGDRVMQVSENRYEWIVADFAIQFARAVHVPAHAPLTGPQIAYQIRDSGAKLVLLSNVEQARKLALCADRIPDDVRFLSYDLVEETIGGAAVATLAHEWSKESGEYDDRFIESALSQVTADSLATILYTSGTTGEPKGVMLSQRNLTSNTLATLQAFGERETDVRLNFLPLSHIFARTCDLNTWVARGSRLVLAQSRESVLADCAKMKPTLLNGVPYFYDKLRRYLCEQGADQTPGSLRELLGGNIRLCCSGGAALPDHVFDFFWQQEVPLLQGYGLSESSPVITVSNEEFARRSASGRVIPGVDLKIADDGEVVTRGPHVMTGYWKQPDATASVIKNGWLHTGDLGRIDDDGFLFITGRKKEILVTAGGKNIAPVQLEALLTESPLIAQALVVGDGKNYLTALIVPDPDVLRKRIAEAEFSVTSAAEALEHPTVLEWCATEIAEQLREVAPYEQVRKFTLLDRGFTIESGEMTPKLSLRRATIVANFQTAIDAMYRRESNRD